MSNQTRVCSNNDFFQLLERVKRKDQIALARAITLLENEPENALSIEELYAVSYTHLTLPAKRIV